MTSAYNSRLPEPTPDTRTMKDIEDSIRSMIHSALYTSNVKRTELRQWCLQAAFSFHRDQPDVHTLTIRDTAQQFEEWILRTE